MTVSRRLRYEILRRDNHACRYCGASAPDVPLTVDHVIPVALGGSDEPSNLVTACQDCNNGKAATNPDAPLVADVSSRALQWREAIELAAALASRDREHQRGQLREFWRYWNDMWAAYFGDWRPELPPDCDRSLEKWLSLGLPPIELRHFTDKVVDKYAADRHLGQYDVWKYFAGCCWRALRELQERAKTILDGAADGS